MRALGESGQADNTLIMFLSDNGMAFPFSNPNCYLHSTRTPWIVCWPGRVAPGSIDERHFISGIDFMIKIFPQPQRCAASSFLRMMSYPTVGHTKPPLILLPGASEEEKAGCVGKSK